MWNSPKACCFSFKRARCPFHNCIELLWNRPESLFLSLKQAFRPVPQLHSVIVEQAGKPVSLK
ncbi:hypothetical protein QUB16_19825 [Microcoleus sp. D3_18a_C4]